MDELSNKDKKGAEYSKEKKTLIKTLMSSNFQNHIIRHILTNILSINEKTNE